MINHMAERMSYPELFERGRIGTSFMRLSGLIGELVRDLSKVWIGFFFIIKLLYRITSLLIPRYFKINWLQESYLFFEIENALIILSSPRI